MKKKILSLALVLTLCAGLFVPVSAAEAEGSQRKFDDVSDQWFASAVLRVAEQGMMNGYGNGKFGPEDLLNLDQVAQVLYNIQPEDYSTPPGYPPLEGSYWAEEAVRWVVYNHIFEAKGLKAVSENYSIPATREEAAAYLYRMAAKLGVVQNVNATIENLGDDVDPFLARDLANAKSVGIINGFDDGQIHAKGQLTRAQFAQMLCNLQDLASKSGIEIKAVKHSSEKAPTETTPAAAEKTDTGITEFILGNTTFNFNSLPAYSSIHNDKEWVEYCKSLGTRQERMDVRATGWNVVFDDEPGYHGDIPGYTFFNSVVGYVKNEDIGTAHGMTVEEYLSQGRPW